MLRMVQGVVVSLVVLVQATIAESRILPPNNLHITKRTKKHSGITFDQSKQLFAQIKSIYADAVTEHGGTLEIINDWDEEEVNAFANREENTWVIHMFGGLAKRPEMTIDGLALVVCHELGHHLGGFPFTRDWAANEGQADYFATLSCAKELWKNDANGNQIAARTITSTARNKCDEIWDRAADRKLCYRTANASHDLAKLLALLDESEVSFDTPSTREVRRTYSGHPDAQCRLDTLFAGARCKNAFAINVIPGILDGSASNELEAEEDSARYTCTESGGFAVGLRPTCWFKPRI